jgi:hypothetical protein
MNSYEFLCEFRVRVSLVNLSIVWIFNFIENVQRKKESSN